MTDQMATGDAADQPDPPRQPDPIDRATAALEAGRHDEADAIAAGILAADPDAAPALAVRGYAATKRNELAAAADLFGRALALRQEAPWHALMADLCRALFRLDAALHHAREAVRLAPRSARPRPLAALGRVLVEQGDLDGAAEAFLAILAIDAEDPNGHFCLGEVLLMRGEFLPGWQEYAWRLRIKGYRDGKPVIHGAEWNGMRLPAGRLLVVAEQGYGDTIQFSRFLTEAASRCRELVLACGADLAGLLGPIPGVARTIDGWTDIPPFSAYAWITSLGTALAVEADRISGAPYLAADPDRQASWMGELAARAPGAPRIGLFWSGRRQHANNARRSIPLDRLRPIIDTATASGALLVSLQRERTDGEAASLAALGIVDPAASLTDFAATASLVASLDLVISVDSAVIHLTGALGRTGWLMTPRPPDWRWGFQGEESRWYDSLRLFRQPVAGDWDGVIARIADLLPAFIQARRSAS